MLRHGPPSRKPPIAVRRLLAAEVGFGCPVEGCASPYLEWHHFDPEWRVEKHHRPDGMIALCHEHHAKAGAGAFTVDQLRELKKVGATNTENVAGRFDILRQDMAFKSGAFWFVETPNMIVYRGTPLLWFSRDDQRLMRVSLQIPGPNGWRLRMEENYWFNLADASQVHCPPGGADLTVEYPDGDRVAIRFSAPDDETRSVAGEASTRVTVEMRIQGLGIELGRDTQIGRTSFSRDSSMVIGHCANGLAIG